MNFNIECWLMLLGFPWIIGVMIVSNLQLPHLVEYLYGKMTRKLCRLLVRAHVTELYEVPHFIVIIEAEGFQGQSWTIQCENISCLVVYLKMRIRYQL
jgi:hypothetical protein